LRGQEGDRGCKTGQDFDIAVSEVELILNELRQGEKEKKSGTRIERGSTLGRGGGNQGGVWRCAWRATQNQLQNFILLCGWLEQFTRVRRRRKEHTLLEV